MEIRKMFSRSKPTAPLSVPEIERLRAERDYEADDLPRLKLRARMGRREDQEALTVKEQQIAELDQRIESLQVTEEHTRDTEAAKRIELPQAEAENRSELQALVGTLVKARSQVQAIVAKHQEVIAKFADLNAQQRGYTIVKGLQNRDLFILAGAESPLFVQILGEYEALSQFLRDCAACGLSVPGSPAPKSSAPTRVHAPMKIAANRTAAQAADLQDQRGEIERDRIKKIRNQKVAA